MTGLRDCMLLPKHVLDIRGLKGERYPSHLVLLLSFRISFTFFVCVSECLSTRMGTVCVPGDHRGLDPAEPS